ncbi:arylalcohol dehydrogenase [Coprinopsis cinerea okayama7|uniref:Arylalcohol dehydrogenase n=1 Tax=Coprinopsis cinerea (strain Okayama-7 / 130 / ATCC MYA-4618 / FGSC 9003) TaxID=240176 RepID=A8P340_COPC7|nr:arylalcohol dehydrogenase [Coprinopsis cinerea okayama7\|eukprot:XP_001838466.2 arylalcohol dehydrogenase [Coprinopsis cinerea okayama7\
MCALFVSTTPPATKLGFLRQLAKRASARVSGFQLGAMSIGDVPALSANMGEMNKEKSFQLLDTFWDNGGNFIDTAGHYQDNTSEQIIGEWAEARGIRDQLVIATKYSSNHFLPAHSVGRAAYTGNSAKSLRNAVEASLKNLRTSYIDILYVHWWDWETSVEEVMDALHNYVQRGVVLYLGVSDTPAWVVARANEYARRTGKTPFVIYQTMYSIMERSAERDILPFVRDEGMAFAPFGVLAGGKIRSDEEEERRRQTGEKGRIMPWTGGWERTPEEKAVCDALEKVKTEVGANSLNAVAIAYVMHKAQFVFPIVGGRKPEHLTSNIEALEISLSDEQMAFLDNVKPLDVGFPLSLIGDGTTYPPLLWSSSLQKVPKAQPIRPTCA